MSGQLWKMCHLFYCAYEVHGNVDLAIWLQYYKHPYTLVSGFFYLGNNPHTFHSILTFPSKVIETWCGEVRAKGVADGTSFILYSPDSFPRIIKTC